MSRLAHLFALCIQFGTVPSQWNRSLIFLLPKTTVPPITCDDVRPLSILSMFRRLFESLILPAFVDPSKDYCKLHPSQAGFRHGYSTLTQAAVCHHAIESRSVEFIIFLDFKAAYDITLSSQVMAALKARRMPPRLQSLVFSSMFTDASYQLVVNSVLSDSISRNRGLPQGSPLSPIIFNLFIDSLIVELNRINSSNIPRCLFYADDGALLAPDIATAKHLLCVAERWANDHGMIYNVSKCGILSIHGVPVQLTLHGLSIPIVHSYKYLGFPMTSKGIDFCQHLKNLAESSNRFLDFIQFDGHEWSPGVRWAIYRTFIRPQMEYGAPLLKEFADMRSDHSFFDPFQSIQDRAFRWILFSNADTPRLHQGILGALPVSLRFTHLRCRFQLHIDQSSTQNPLRVIIHSLTALGKFVGRFRHNTLYNEFKRSKIYQEDPIRSKITLSEYLSQHLLSLRSAHLCTLQTQLILLTYITIDGRTRSLTDHVLNAPPAFQSEFVSWRKGVLFVNRKCPCKSLWTRRHIKCLPVVTLPPELESLFQAEKQKQSEKFVCLDFLLNVKEWDLAHHVIDLWSKALPFQYISLWILLIS